MCPRYWMSSCSKYLAWLFAHAQASNEAEQRQPYNRVKKCSYSWQIEMEKEGERRCESWAVMKSAAITLKSFFQAARCGQPQGIRGEYRVPGNPLTVTPIYGRLSLCRSTLMLFSFWWMHSRLRLRHLHSQSHLMSQMICIWHSQEAQRQILASRVFTQLLLCLLV